MLLYIILLCRVGAIGAPITSSQLSSPSQTPLAADPTANETEKDQFGPFSYWGDSSNLTRHVFARLEQYACYLRGISIWITSECRTAFNVFPESSPSNPQRPPQYLGLSTISDNGDNGDKVDEGKRKYLEKLPT